MARIVVGVYMVRYPLGGMMSMSLQLAVGLRRLGHEVVVVEKSGWKDACFDPSRGAMTDDCAYGVRVVGELLERFGLGEKWCFVDRQGRPHGLGAGPLADALATCDAFIDAGTHGAWLNDLGERSVKVLLDGEPGWTQMRWAKQAQRGETLPRYDAYFTVGQNVGTAGSSIPTVGRRWQHVLYPVLLDQFEPVAPDEMAPLTTVMNWQAHEALEYDGRVFGQKDVEFERFMALPSLATPARFQLAAAGRGLPRARLERAGWQVRDAHEVTVSYDAYRDFVRRSRGEFSVAKNVFVATSSGWFGDRSAAYLAAGRPVVIQDTGISAHLPCGEGLLPVAGVEEAAAAVREIEGDYDRHSRAARDLAREFLSADRVLPRFLEAIGL
ncbi:MAG TPA: hypothetical protein VGB87_23180 [Vicinamibacteria bacterium]